VLTGLLLAACGSSNGPTPVPQPPPAPPSGGGSVNLAPVIDPIAVSSERTEVDTEITLTASVKDEETPVDQLKFEWKAEGGTFSGEGASVKWRAPRDITTPADYSVVLTVTETYGAPNSFGVRPQNVATVSSPAIRVHNSPKELGDMSMLFLSDFANSSVPASECVRNFSDSCAGKFNERDDIESNRKDFDILDSSLNLRRVSVAPNGMSASMTVACAFTSRIKACSGTQNPSCKVGGTEKVQGNCNLTAVYEQKRWWLCVSTFDGVLVPSMRGFFGIR